MAVLIGARKGGGNHRARRETGALQGGGRPVAEQRKAWRIRNRLAPPVIPHRRRGDVGRISGKRGNTRRGRACKGQRRARRMECAIWRANGQPKYRRIGDGLGDLVAAPIISDDRRA